MKTNKNNRCYFINSVSELDSTERQNVHLLFVIFLCSLRLRVYSCHHVPIKPVKLCLVSVPLTNVVSGPLSKLWALKVNPNS